jgi:hypothetical protein
MTNANRSRLYSSLMIPYLLLNAVVTALAADALHQGQATVVQVLQYRYMGAFVTLGIYLLITRKRMTFTDAGLPWIAARSFAGLLQSGAYYTVAGVAGILVAAAGKATFPLWVSTWVVIRNRSVQGLFFPMLAATAGVLVYATGTPLNLLFIGLTVGGASALITGTQAKLAEYREPSLRTVFWQMLFTFACLSVANAWLSNASIPMHLRVEFAAQGLVFALAQLLYDVANTKGDRVLSSYLSYCNLPISLAADFLYLGNVPKPPTLVALGLFTVSAALVARRPDTSQQGQQSDE